ncbi:hypothetical protein TRFO_34719 [Tritrichomonas foetus]|uniref:Uncharacterized protein n=1 Tax=Tritrichomonas foetus TaxID=1144522 RepID=A0A1J4JN09_9EUKA|nr:hypothetical protein TRFO_34719 [Tritrichomonas foetus]|eukprot:OHS98923.1 hypothetical protein TRFO_34719 [Tritrichomonas foetus]
MCLSKSIMLEKEPIKSTSPHFTNFEYKKSSISSHLNLNNRQLQTISSLPVKRNKVIYDFVEGDFSKFSQKIVLWKNPEEVMCDDQIVHCIMKCLNSPYYHDYIHVVQNLLYMITNIFSDKSLAILFREDIALSLLPLINTSFPLAIEVLNCVKIFIINQDRVLCLIKNGFIDAIINLLRNCQQFDIYFFVSICKVSLKILKRLSIDNYSCMNDVIPCYVNTILCHAIEMPNIECLFLRNVSYLVQNICCYRTLKSTEFFDYFFSIDDIFKTNINDSVSIILNFIIINNDSKMVNFDNILPCYVQSFQNSSPNYSFFDSLYLLFRNTMKMQSHQFYQSGLIQCFRSHFLNDNSYITKKESIYCYCAFLMYGENEYVENELQNMDLNEILNYLEDDPSHESITWIIGAFIRIFKIVPFDELMRERLNLFIESLKFDNGDFCLHEETICRLHLMINDLY